MKFLEAWNSSPKCWKKRKAAPVRNHLAKKTYRKSTGK